MQVVCLGEAPPASDLVVDREACAFAGEGDKKGGRDAVTDSTSDDVAVAIAHSEQKGAVPEATTGLKGMESSFDREAVDALCRQAGSDFFLYGTPPRNISTPA